MVLRPMFLSSDILPKNDIMIGIIGYTQGITQLRIAPPMARRNIFKIDDTLDVFAVHGIGGIFGTLMIAIFGYTSFVTQLLGLIIVGVFTIIVTYSLIKIVSIITPLRVDEETETNGLDLSVHGERAYDVNS